MADAVVAAPLPTTPLAVPPMPWPAKDVAVVSAAASV
jgi:hypothetical protein